MVAFIVRPIGIYPQNPSQALNSLEFVRALSARYVKLSLVDHIPAPNDKIPWSDSYGYDGQAREYISCLAQILESRWISNSYESNRIGDNHPIGF